MKRTIICIVMLMALLLTACGTTAEEPSPTEAPAQTKASVAKPTENISVDYNLNKELAEVEAKEDELSASADLMTQMGMNGLSAQLLELWDNELNSLWTRYVDLLDEGEKAEAIKEENAWISDKEAKVLEEGAEYEGGSMQGMVMNDVEKRLTRERCYVVATYIGDIVGQTVQIPD